MLLVFGASGGVGSQLTELACSDNIFTSIFGVFRADCDVTDEHQVAYFFDQVPGIDAAPKNPLYLINATGRNVSGYVHKLPTEDFEAVVSVNLTGSFNLLKHFTRVTRQKPGSSVLFLSSVVTKRATVPGVAAYAAAKAGLEGLVRASAQELARYETRVNCIRMGYFDTGMLTAIPDDPKDKIKKAIPLGSWGGIPQLWDACKAVLTNEYMTGAVVDLNGGLA